MRGSVRCIAYDPGIRLRDIATRWTITERTAYGIVTDLTEGGYVLKEEGRPAQPLPDPVPPAACRTRSADPRTDRGGPGPADRATADDGGSRRPAQVACS